jgi:heptosyltransferase-2
LVIQTAFLGDAILTLPMIQKLKEKYPDSVLSVLCIPSTKEIFESSLSVDEVLEYDKKKSQKSFLNLIKLFRILREKKYTHVYSPHKSVRSTLIALFTGADSTFGFDIAGLSFLYKTIIIYQKNIHEVARNLELIGFNTSGNNWKILPEINISTEMRKKIDNIPVLNDNYKFVAIAPGSVWKTKVYPEKYIIDLIKLLIIEKYFIVLIGGNEDDLLCKEIEKLFSSRVKSFAGLLNVRESVALLKHCSFLISNDSAPTHIGMIANIPVATIYCSTVPAFGFYPYNKSSHYISYDELDCKPCGIHGYKECPLKTFDCGYKLLPGTIISKLKEKSIL